MTEWSEMGVTWTPARVAFNSRGTGILPVGPVGFQPAEVKRSGGTPDRPTDWKSVPRFTDILTSSTRLRPAVAGLPPGLYA